MSFWDWLWRRPSPAVVGTGSPVPVTHDIPLPRMATASADTPSAAGIALTENEEGCVLTAMKDVDGVYVLGYGNKIFDGKQVVAGQTCSAVDADLNCRAHSQQCATAIIAAVKFGLTQGQLDALTDFVYNVGLGGFLSSTILKTLNARQSVSEDMFTRWNKITKNGVHVELPTLTARRRREYQLFLS